MTHRLLLNVLPESYAVCRLAAGEPFPAWAAGGFVSLTRTTDELSVVCRQGLPPEGVRREEGWRLLRVSGPLDFSLIGVLASLLAPLAEAGVGVLAISTFDTDHLLVREEGLGRAVQALRHAGHQVA
jgi:hypothetical protein